jgi:hypothetical protein
MKCTNKIISAFQLQALFRFNHLYQMEVSLEKYSEWLLLIFLGFTSGIRVLLFHKNS